MNSRRSLAHEQQARSGTWTAGAVWHMDSRRGLVAAAALRGAGRTTALVGLRGGLTCAWCTGCRHVHGVQISNRQSTDGDQSALRNNNNNKHACREHTCALLGGVDVLLHDLGGVADGGVERSPVCGRQLRQGAGHRRGPERVQRGAAGQKRAHSQDVGSGVGCYWQQQLVCAARRGAAAADRCTGQVRGGRHQSAHDDRKPIGIKCAARARTCSSSEWYL